MNYIQKAKRILKKLKELQRKSTTKAFVVILFLSLLLFAFLIKDTTDDGTYLATAANIGADSSFGDRELPIYCVDTTENKVALSFDAAWGAAR